MSEQPKPKYVTFRDLRAVVPKAPDPVAAPLPAPPVVAPADGSSLPAPNAVPAANETLPPTTQQAPPLTTVAAPRVTGGAARRDKSAPEASVGGETTIRRSLNPPASNDEVAPSRDFQRIPNSVIRQAIPEGIFRGKSKQVWDFLWSISRGSIIPVRQVRRSRREIQKGSGLGSMVTVDAAIEHLTAVGLLKVLPAVGSLQGNTYEVYTPEEINPRYTSTSSTSSTTSLTQKVVVLDVPESSSTSTTQIIENKASYKVPNTFFKTIDDEHTHTLAEMVAAIVSGTQSVCGVFQISEQEKAKWGELGILLMRELEEISQKVDQVSSAPAVLTAHLRRCLAKHKRAAVDAGVIRQPVAADDAKAATKTDHATKIDLPTAETAKANFRDGVRKISAAENTTPEKNASRVADANRSREGDQKPGSRYSFAQRRDYAQQQRPQLGAGWIVESATGKYDELIEAWLSDTSRKNAGTQDAAANAQGDAPEASRSAAALRASECPDCRGTGMYYPQGYSKGAAKCRHASLISALDKTAGGGGDAKTETVAKLTSERGEKGEEG